MIVVELVIVTEGDCDELIVGDGLTVIVVELETVPNCVTLSLDD